MTGRPVMPFADAVAERAGVAADEVVGLLEKHGVAAAPHPPPARRLSIRRIEFGGTKRFEDGRVEPFRFEWVVDHPGLWVLASEDNQVGKSTVIEVALWALRGKPKRITQVVRGWIEDVAVSFQADATLVEVAFRSSGGEPDGTVRSTVGGRTNEQAFGSEDQFKRAMQEVMLEALALEPVPASASRQDGRVTAHDDGWLAYTGAFLSDSRSDAILGEHVQGTDLTQRLLQVYLGLPWATTMFQARSRARQLRSEADQRRRRLSALGGKSVDELEAELAGVRKRIADEGLRSDAARELAEAQADYDRLAGLVRIARQDADDARLAEEEVKAAEVRANRVVLALREDRAASLFLRRLSPVCCPRCERPIGAERRRLELEARQCSVCKDEVPEGDAGEAEANLAQAVERHADARKLATDAEKAARDKEAAFATLRRSLFAAGERLQDAAATGTAADAHVLGRRAERLEGVLEVARALVQAEEADDVAARVLEAAEAEASTRLAAAAEAVLGPVSEEIRRVATQLGMRDLSRVVLKRNAHVDVHQGGAVSTWGGLAPGAQLRLRIAAVVALVRRARELGVGRHPGLLLIDAPGREEMNAGDVGEVMGELARLADEVAGLQVFVDMQGVERAATAAAPGRLLARGRGEFLW